MKTSFFRPFLLCACSTLRVLPAIAQEPQVPLQDQTSYAHKIINWRLVQWKTMVSTGPRSYNTPEEIKNMADAEKEFLPIDTRIIPFLLITNTRFIGFTHFRWHTQVLRREPNLALSTTKEFPEIISQVADAYSSEMMIAWWLKGKERTPMWFAERYPKWKTLLQGNDIRATKISYREVIEVGIAALPLWVQKLDEEEQPNTRSQIIGAISILTNGEVKTSDTPEQVKDWWKANALQWTIPFPKSQGEFLQFLETEADTAGHDSEHDIGVFAIPAVVTLSYIEDYRSVEALIRLVGNASPIVRDTSLEQLQRLFGDQLPPEYRPQEKPTSKRRLYMRARLLNVKINKENWPWAAQIPDDATATHTARDLTTWWQQVDKTKLTFHWDKTKRKFDW